MGAPEGSSNAEVFPVTSPGQLAAAILGAGGGEDESSAGNQADAAFVADMVPHHQGAVMMATMTNQSAGHDELDEMVDEIISVRVRQWNWSGKPTEPTAGVDG